MLTFEQAKPSNTQGMVAMPVRHRNPKTIVAQAVNWALHGNNRKTFFYSRTAESSEQIAA